ncbi:MAG: circadian clock KaiB family protein [Elusimicrobia bacterium]|nr:circadian clock KaiB family protein [Elusimicrobiota bacterium]
MTCGRKSPRYKLQLFLTGATARSRTALENIRRFCERELPGNFDLKVIDIYQQPALAGRNQIIAAPTLIKTSPSPRRQLIGDMSDERKIRVSLGLVSRDP